jgi:hypothetical protein
MEFVAKAALVQESIWPLWLICCSIQRETQAWTLDMAIAAASDSSIHEL